MCLHRVLEAAPYQTEELAPHLCSVICSGFALEDNPSDLLMVKCPLPPVEQWDEVIRARLLFLLKQGLAPQLFLPASNLPATAKNDVRSAQYMPYGSLLWVALCFYLLGDVHVSAWPYFAIMEHACS